jgi:hypothetical protein
MPPIKSQIRSKIEENILAIAVVDGFNFDWDSNTRDLTQAQFPNFYVRMINEVNLDFDSGETNFQSYDNEVETQITIWTKNDDSGYDPQRISEDELDKAEDDLKRLFGDSGQQGSTLGGVGADMFYYMGSETDYFESNDIFVPSKRTLKFRLRYTQDRLDPEQIAC